MDTKTIGERLRKLRKDKGQSMVFVARKLGIGYSTLCSYEYGLRSPCDDVKIRIARYFGVPVEKIFFNEENSET